MRRGEEVCDRDVDKHGPAMGVVFSMRHSYAATAPTWTNTWSSTYRRLRIVAALTATNVVFIGLILNADAAAVRGGFKAKKLSRFPRFCFLDPRQARRSMAPSLAARCSH